MPASALILGIESSCDDTAAAVVRVCPPGPGEILSSEVRGQAELHARFGGVVPEIAARAHAERLDGIAAAALRNAGVTLAEVDAIAVTAGPGLIGGVLSGVMFAKGLGFAAGRPVLAVNHLAGHALTPRLSHGLAFPYLLLLVSGGHCQFLAVEAHDRFLRLGGTIDDAPGEAFDKLARLLGLAQPGGPAVEREAAGGDAQAIALPRPLIDRDDANMSFSGLKTAALRARDALVAAHGGLRRADRADLCAAFQRAVADILAAKTSRALARMPSPPTALAVAGGVAANAEVRTRLAQIADEAGLPFVAPPLPLCTDNGAMIAWAGGEAYLAGERGGLDFAARPRWPLDQTSPALLGSGRKGAKA